jgi:hypothetical protein
MGAVGTHLSDEGCTEAKATDGVTDDHVTTPDGRWTIPQH